MQKSNKMETSVTSTYKPTTAPVYLYREENEKFNSCTPTKANKIQDVSKKSDPSCEKETNYEATELVKLKSLLQRIIDWENSIYSPVRTKDSIINIVEDIKKCLTQLKINEDYFEYVITWDYAYGINSNSEVTFLQKKESYSKEKTVSEKEFKEMIMNKAKWKAQEDRVKNVKVWECKKISVKLLAGEF